MSHNGFLAEMGGFEAVRWFFDNNIEIMLCHNKMQKTVVLSIYLKVRGNGQKYLYKDKNHYTVKKV